MKIKITSVALLLSGFFFFSEGMAQEFPTPPNEIQNVVAVPGDSSVQLSWERGTDPDGVVVNYKVYYGTSSVQTEDDLYDDEREVGNMLSYEITGLVNGTEYFFSVTGIDDEGIEGETYSLEVSAIPEAKEEIIPPETGEETPVEEEIPSESTPEEEVLTDVEEPLSEVEPDQGIVMEEDENMPEESEEGEESEVFEGPVYPAAPVDTVPPLDAMDLAVDSGRLASENVVVLSWTPSPNMDGDVVDQILYTRRGGEEWDGGYSLGAGLSTLELEVDTDENYEVKVITVDETGNESEGITLSFTTSLSETGPGSIGTVVALSILFFVGLVILGRRRAY
ncbi:fibronectin type III domain-containing protein [Candidatus Gracilibacteria bacterium]|nr:fibronectin type III domain-containing protein [Candidatus Gracilibacteria bacterium]